MKQKDFILVAVVVFISGMASFFLSSKLFSAPKNRQQEVEVVEKISSDFPKPDSRYFNTNALDPTQNITIGENQNPKPFSSGN